MPTWYLNEEDAMRWAVQTPQDWGADWWWGQKQRLRESKHHKNQAPSDRDREILDPVSSLLSYSPSPALVA